MAEDWYTGMDAEFARRLQMLIGDSGGKASVGSGYRSVEEQTYLWNNAVAKYGEDEARNWVAPPGSSNHNHGVAADLAFADNATQQWVHENASRYGLSFPMSWEPWHIEPTGVREGTYKSTVHVDGTTPGSVDAYTNTPPGHTSPVDATQRFDLGYQLVSLNDIMMTPNAGVMNNPAANVEMAAEPSNQITRN